jgi:hypothetical protein
MENNHERLIDYKDIQKMVFIFNALDDGWVIRKISENKYEFIKNNKKIQKEIILEECIKKYLKCELGI